MSNQVNELWRDYLLLNLAAPSGQAFNDLDFDYFEQYCIDLGVPADTISDCFRNVAKYAYDNLSVSVAPVAPLGRVAVACLNSGISLAEWIAGTHRSDLWRDFLMRGGPGVISYADLSSGLDIALDAGGTVTGTYTRTDADGTVYYDDGTGYLVAAVSNTPYVHGKYGMYFEFASANLFLHAIALTNVIWELAGATVTELPFPSPVPSIDAFRLQETVDVASPHYIGKTNITKAASAYVTQSWYVHPDERTIVMATILDSVTPGNGIDCYFDLNNGVYFIAFRGLYTNGAASIIALSDGWFRVSVSALTSAETLVDAALLLVNENNDTVYDGDGTSGVYVWGAQLEQGTNVPSTLMASGAVSCTRSASSLTYPVTAYDIYPAPGAAFTFMAELMDIRTTNSNAAFGRVYESVGETSRRLAKGGSPLFNGLIGAQSVLGVVPQKQMLRLWHSVGADNKLAVNGSVVGTQTPTDVIAGAATSLRIGGRTAAADIYHGFIKRFAFISEAVIA